MNYENILSEDAAQQFREEGATTVVINLYDSIGEMIRDVEVQLTENKCFAVAGKTALAKVAMAAHFAGREVDGEVWFPFGTLCKFAKDKNKLIAEVAVAAGVDPSDLKWSFINER